RYVGADPTAPREEGEAQDRRPAADRDPTDGDELAEREAKERARARDQDNPSGGYRPLRFGRKAPAKHPSSPSGRTVWGCREKSGSAAAFCKPLITRPKNPLLHWKRLFWCSRATPGPRRTCVAR